MKKFLCALLITCSSALSLSAMPIMNGPGKPPIPPKGNYAEKDTPEALLFGSNIGEPQGSILRWKNFTQNFGMEEISISFPGKYVVAQNDSAIVAYTYEGSVRYYFSGLYPAIGNINAQAWFNDTLAAANRHPYELRSYVITYIEKYNYWVLDYITHDTCNNVVVKSRSIVTPFNGYNMQASYPYGCYDIFDLFTNTFTIYCQCGH